MDALRCAAAGTGGLMVYLAAASILMGLRMLARLRPHRALIAQVRTNNTGIDDLAAIARAMRWNDHDDMIQAQTDAVWALRIAAVLLALTLLDWWWLA